MRNFILFLGFLVSVACAFAQDVIVMKDGSTIVAKVENITANEVTYKKYSNLKGPRYTLAVQDIKAINYENGTSDKFDSRQASETTAATAPSNEVQSHQYAASQEKKDVFIQETASSYSDDMALKKMYHDMNDWQTYEKKAKRLKLVGWTVGPVLFAAGLTTALIGTWSYEDITFYSVGGVLMAGGIGTTVGCLVKSNQYMKKSRSMMQSAAIWQYNLNCGSGTNLALSVNAIHSAYTKEHTLGIGLNYSF